MRSLADWLYYKPKSSHEGESVKSSVFKADEFLRTSEGPVTLEFKDAGRSYRGVGATLLPSASVGFTHPERNGQREGGDDSLPNSRERSLPRHPVDPPPRPNPLPE